MNYKWLLLDADGTLFDYDRAEAVALKRTFEQCGYRFRETYVEVYRRINGRLWLEFEKGRVSQRQLRTRRFELFFETIQVAGDLERVSATYLGHLADGAYLIEGAEDLVRVLYRKIGLVLITNGLAEVQRPRFARSALNGLFDDIVISGEVGFAKPDKRIFDLAFQRMDNPGKDQVLIVGDSLTSDIRGGQNYGIDTCWFNPQQRPQSGEVQSDYEISELRDLLDIMGIAGAGPAV